MSAASPTQDLSMCQQTAKACGVCPHTPVKSIIPLSLLCGCSRGNLYDSASATFRLCVCVSWWCTARSLLTTSGCNNPVRTNDLLTRDPCGSWSKLSTCCFIHRFQVFLGGKNICMKFTLARCNPKPVQQDEGNANIEREFTFEKENPSTTPPPLPPTPPPPPPHCKLYTATKRLTGVQRGDQSRGRAGSGGEERTSSNQLRGKTESKMDRLSKSGRFWPESATKESLVKS